MALADFTISLPGIGLRQFSQHQVDLGDSSVVTLATGVTGKRIALHGIIISSDTTTAFVIRSGSDKALVFHVTGGSGVKVVLDALMPTVVADSGQDVTIQSSAPVLAASATAIYRESE